MEEKSYMTQLETIANHYGFLTQLDKLIEEASELVEAAIEYVDDQTQDRRENIANEIADVQIMIDQIVSLDDLGALVWQAKRYKLARQLDRIKQIGGE